MESALENARQQTRRQLLGLAGAWALMHVASVRADSARAAEQGQPSASDAQLVQALRAGNCIALMRHAITEPGIGDPDGMRLADCSTQRNLSEQGRAQSKHIGEWFRAHQLNPVAVRSSQWCRCLHTAQLAFPDMSVGPWPALNSFFRDPGSDRDRQMRESIAAARSLALRRSTGQFEVWVTHQVVITALTGRYAAPGELIVARYQESAAQAPQAPLAVLANGLVRNTLAK